VLKQHLVQAGHAGHFFHSVGNEADDVIATLVRLASNNAQGNVTIMTSDRDLWQLIDSKVSVWNPISKLLIRQEDIFKAFAVRQPRHIPLYKSLWGDAGDCVPNAVPRTQKHLLPLILRGDGQLDTFRADVKQSWDSLSPRCRELYDLGAPQVQINWDLVYLDRHCTLVRE
jgi:DNA polymerase I